MISKKQNTLVTIGGLLLILFPIILGLYDVFEEGVFEWFGYFISGGVSLIVVGGVLYETVKMIPKAFKDFLVNKKIKKYRISNMREHGMLCSLICHNIFNVIKNEIKESEDYDRIHYLISELVLEYMNDKRNLNGDYIFDWKEYIASMDQEKLSEDIIFYIKKYIHRLNFYGV